MELRNIDTSTKILYALGCLFGGLFLVWNIGAHITAFYELRLDTETCKRVQTLGLEPTSNCIVTAPYRPFGAIPGGSLILPDGNDILITPVEAKQTRKSLEWTSSMKAQLWVALLLWGMTLVLLIGVYKSNDDS